MPKVTYIEHNGTQRVADLPVGENVMRGALYNGIPGIVGECGGGLACATCHCYVDAAWTGKTGTPSELERQMLESTASETKPNSRLSCQITVTEELDGLVVHTPEAQF
jgi:ferredoxin, 2Fe-2S